MSIGYKCNNVKWNNMISFNINLKRIYKSYKWTVRLYLK